MQNIYLILILLAISILGLSFSLFYKKKSIHKRKLFFWLSPLENSNIKILDISSKKDFKLAIQMQKRLDEIKDEPDVEGVDIFPEMDTNFNDIFEKISFFGIFTYYDRVKKEFTGNFSINLNQNVEGDLSTNNIYKQNSFRALKKIIVEAKLEAIGFRILNSKIQSRDLKKGILDFDWKCSFNVSGDFLFSINFNLEVLNQKISLGTLEQRIEVI